MNEKAYVVEVKDPLGNTVICTKERWQKHILEDSEHTIMEGNEVAVQETLKNPDTIYRSSQNENRTVYFKRGATSTYNSKLTTKVVTEKVTNDTRKVVTAWPQKEEKGGIGDAIYTKKND